MTDTIRKLEDEVFVLGKELPQKLKREAVTIENPHVWMAQRGETKFIALSGMVKQEGYSTSFLVDGSDKIFELLKYFGVESTMELEGRKVLVYSNGGAPLAFGKLNGGK